MLKCKRLCHSGVMTAFSLSSHFSLLFTRSHFSILSPFISLILSWHVPPSFYSFPLPPPSQFEIPACCLPYVNNYLLPTESNYAKRAYFFLLSYCWTFETRRIVWSPCLEALTRYNMGSMTLFQIEDLVMWWEKCIEQKRLCEIVKMTASKKLWSCLSKRVLISVNGKNSALYSKQNKGAFDFPSK